MRGGQQRISSTHTDIHHIQSSTQDLFSDPTADSAAELLLERDTHLFLKIQLDADKGKINVNDASLDISGNDKSAPVTVVGIKAEVGRFCIALLPPSTRVATLLACSPFKRCCILIFIHLILVDIPSSTRP
jgi:hypothetical protein